MYKFIDLDDLNQNEHLIPFTIIGADGALMRHPIHQQTSFDLGEAERLELVVRFGEGMMSDIKHIYMTCRDLNSDLKTIQMKVEIVDSYQVDSYAPQCDYNFINVPFTNLSCIP